MKLGHSFALAAAFTLFAASAYAQGQPDFSKVEIKVTPLGNNTYMLEGQGGNVVAAVGNDGVIQVDGEFAPLHDKIKAAIDKASGGKPIKYLINTHFHGDHTGGNGPFAKDGTTIVAHQNLAMRLEHGSTNGMSGAKTAPVEDWATDFDHTDDEWAADPFPIWDELRRTCPVAHSDRYAGVWLPTRHEDISAIAYDTENFTSRSIIVTEYRPPDIAPQGIAPPISSDPPFHHGARRLLLPTEPIWRAGLDRASTGTRPRVDRR